MQIVCRHFSELSGKAVYQILQLRNEVFVVEQNCVFQDADNKDLKAYHLCIYDEDELVAYARLLDQHISYNEISIGRVVTAPSVRRKQYGKTLMQEAIRHCYMLFGKQSIKIGAQLYLKSFYESFGFVQCSDVYDEDGIDHIQMLLA